ncbi:Alpha/Beta hydrolase protein [Paraphysoderma sedebokerense]|nr:Alpha/Beta hydrolase protein [Paraphysoderma sedebokerense]
MAKHLTLLAITILSLLSESLAGPASRRIHLERRNWEERQTAVTRNLKDNDVFQQYVTGLDSLKIDVNIFKGESPAENWREAENLQRPNGRGLEDIGDPNSANVEVKAVRPNRPEFVPPELLAAKSMVTYAGVAYCKNVSALLDWSCEPYCKNPDTAGTKFIASVYDSEIDTKMYIARNDEQKRIIVGFRGTASLRNWIENLQFWRTEYPFEYDTAGLSKKPYVHQGFLNIYNAVRDELRAYLMHEVSVNVGYSVNFVGHSLGGALASLAVVDSFYMLRSISGFNPSRQLKVTTVNGPRVGNDAFSQLLDSLGVDKFRIINENDLVPQLPPQWIGYKHFSGEIYTFGETAFRCEGPEDPQCSNSRVPFLDVNRHTMAFNISLGMGVCQ